MEKKEEGLPMNEEEEVPILALSMLHSSDAGTYMCSPVVVGEEEEEENVEE